MKKRILLFILTIAAIGVVYLLVWPVPVNPQAWNAPTNGGYTGVFSVNNKLAQIELLDIGDNFGPESIAVDAQGHIYAATHGGKIVRLEADGTSSPTEWANTEGRPLGIVFDHKGNLIVADAYKGLLSIAPNQEISCLTTASTDGPIQYANNADVATNGRIYFTDSSTKFAARPWGGTYQASLLDIMEHGGHGRLLVYDPVNQSTQTLLKGLNFANGVAISPDQSFVLVVETGSYRIVRYWLKGSKAGKKESFIENLPAFPDNLTTGKDGRFWLALVSPRSAPLDSQSSNPFVRKIIQRLPASFRPQAKPYGHIVALDSSGKVVQNLQDPNAAYPINTEALETNNHLYIGSLFTNKLGRIPKVKLKL